jgi:two-component system, NtrC family, sensor kinase
VNAVGFDGANRRILVVDDNSSIHEDLHKVLGGQDEQLDLEADETILFGVVPDPLIPFEIDSAYQGEEALELVRQSLTANRPYALAFVDIRMPPGWDGLETIEHFREVDPNLQTVICTAHADYLWNDMARRLGRSDSWLILKKPFDNIEVIQLAHALCQKWTASRQGEAKIGDLDRIAAQRTAEATAAYQQYRMIAETASDGIVTMNREGTIQFANTSAANIFGCSAKQLIGASLLQFVPDCVYPLRQATTAAGPDPVPEAGSHLDLRGKNTAGTPLTLEVSFSGFPASGGDATQTAVIRDVTERRRLESNRAHSRRLESIGRLAAGVAHEINTPIQYISDNLTFIERSCSALEQMFDVLQRMSGSGGLQELGRDLIAELTSVREKTKFDHLRRQMPDAVKEALEGARQVAQIVRAMNEFAHPGGEGMTTADLNHVLEITVAVSRNRWKRVAELKLDLAMDLPLIVGAPEALRQAFLNLVINAADAIEDATRTSHRGRGLISISSRRQKDWAEVRIADSGTGIPETFRPRIFEPFFTTKDVGCGTGQGLAITHAIVVQRHRGSIEFQTAVDQGTTFIVKLPLGQPEKNQSDPALIHRSLRLCDTPAEPVDSLLPPLTLSNKTHVTKGAV